MKKRMMKAAALFMSAVMTLSLAACGGGSGSGTTQAAGADGEAADAADWKWERKVTIVCPWGVGGGADGTLRPLQPALEEELGVPVEIVNVEGAGGANGVNYAYKQPADGYTYMLGTQSLIMLDLQKILPMDFKAEFIPVSKLVHSILIVGSSAKAMEGKYTNFDEFIEYAKNHPQELSCGMLTATGADSVAMKQTLAGGLGCDVTEVEDYVKIVSYSSGSEMSSAMAGGHIHISISGIDEVKGLVESGDIVPLISLSEERMSTYPEIECTGEKGIDSYIGTWRGIFCRTDTPAAAVAAMDEAIKKAWDSPDYQEFLKNAVYLDREGYQTGADFQGLIDQEYTTFEEYLKGAGLM
ncbi:MAG TPA: tripartite tricarboxylate transporter substrate binding protein [Candidatus Lachnoclostridium pullistercoris]|uniref:Tripartite tricarboxylate transporter substrate binding protein n=1 Tax=Candidatus Lachnoclostridium pullistercoris TaxID=2838632 RepID=A0A9D2T872_9FIRM|nr:tripartite tricarboxylate transporter substrate binding protein [Candidatus Lachnoclostridium pullistercoris]